MEGQAPPGITVGWRPVSGGAKATCGVTQPEKETGPTKSTRVYIGMDVHKGSVMIAPSRPCAWLTGHARRPAAGPLERSSVFYLPDRPNVNSPEMSYQSRPRPDIPLVSPGGRSTTAAIVEP